MRSVVLSGKRCFRVLRAGCFAAGILFVFPACWSHPFWEQQLGSDSDDGFPLLVLLGLGAAAAGAAVPAPAEGPAVASLAFAAMLHDIHPTEGYTCSFGDIDADGHPDLFLAGEAAAVGDIGALYRNLGDGRFADAGYRIDAAGRAFGSAMADFNGDGRLDLFTSGGIGDNDAYLYFGDAVEGLVDSGRVFSPSGLLNLAVGDADNDGDLDVFFFGFFATPALYWNDGQANFTNAGFTSAIQTVLGAEFGDLDGDGDLDLVTFGADSGGASTTVVYRNDAGTFSNAGVALTPVERGDLELFDADGDGDPDLLFLGESDALTRLQRFYRNDGGFAFTDMGAVFPPANNDPSIVTGDFDNDGDPDVILSGWPSGGRDVSLHRNDGGFAFATMPDSFTSLSEGVNCAADVNGDGALDVLTAGFTDFNEQYTELHYGDGAWGFTLKESEDLTGGEGDAALADMDGDGDLDVALSGFIDYRGAETIVYRNDGGSFTPTGFSVPGENLLEFADFTGDGVPDLLVYQQSSSGDSRDLYTGNGAGGFSAAGETFADLGLTALAAGDLDGDNDLDFVISGRIFPSTYQALVYENDGAGNFADAGVPILPRYAGQAALADIDGDGDLDIVLTGQDSGSAYGTEIYRNDGGMSFTETSQGLPGIDGGSLALGDLDGDGRPELLLSGRTTGSVPLTRIYQNDGAGGFSPRSDGLPDLFSSIAQFVDLDGDGDLDLYLSGRDAIGARLAHIYRNDGAGNLTQADLRPPRFTAGNGTAGDLTGDGLPELILSGFAFSGDSYTSGQIFRNQLQ